jgi:hypothetical protein
MATYAENMIVATQDGRAEAMRFSGGSYTARDMEKVVERLGADLELFLKTAVYGGKGRMTLAGCISQLASFGLDQNSIDDLDDLRQAYNTAKHQPGSSLDYQQTEDLLRRVEASVLEVQRLSIGSVNQVEPIAVTRVFWLLAADHLISGETEIDVCLPIPDVDFPPGLDLINVNMASWPDVRDALSAAGDLREGRGAIPERVYNVWSAESDIAFIGAWEGDYRRFLRAVLPYEKVVDVLPELARGDNFGESLSAILMSAVDLAGTGALLGDEDDLKEQIMDAAEVQYSIPQGKQAAGVAAEIVARLVSQVPEARRLDLTGPYWFSEARQRPHAASALAKDADHHLLVAADARLVAWSGH